MAFNPNGVDVGDVKIMDRVCMTLVAICFLHRGIGTISLLAASFLHMAELQPLKVITWSLTSDCGFLHDSLASSPNG